MVWSGPGAMTRVLIVESHSPALCARDRAAGRESAADMYAGAFRSFDPELSTQIVAPYEDEVARLDGIDAVAFTGSDVEWATDDPRAVPLARVMEDVFARGLPTLGSCNGMQLAAVVLGGGVGASAAGYEDGLARQVRLTAEGNTHPMMAGRNGEFAAPAVHRDEVTALPDGAELLATNTHSRVQAFAYDKAGVSFWGVQYHPEYAAPVIARKIRETGRSDAGFADDLAVMDRDEDAAGRLSVSPRDLQPQQRLTELRNWLEFIQRDKP